MGVATGTTLISAEEYLRSSYKPACDYIDGVLRPKPTPTYKHGKMEFRVCYLINGLDRGFEAVPEQTVKVREGKYLVPDVAVQQTRNLQQPYPKEPVYLCVEVLSSDDRFSDVAAKCEDYHVWGVQHCWLIDPENKQCWEYETGDRPRQVPTNGQITAGEIVLSLDALCRVLSRRGHRTARVTGRRLYWLFGITASRLARLLPALFPNRAPERIRSLARSSARRPRQSVPGRRNSCCAKRLLSA